MNSQLFEGRGDCLDRMIQGEIIYIVFILFILYILSKVVLDVGRCAGNGP
jgi:hypothetical protein